MKRSNNKSGTHSAGDMGRDHKKFNAKYMLWVIQVLHNVSVFCVQNITFLAYDKI